ncbi:hypothetical protein LCGC14_0598660 [marine sediment metagenome]|uniref:Uncharacterized protein n=1 Tax=marine sediment metagenome TaxID=412755 RepID=A0A0F9UJM5_9ZZZZ
MTEKSQIKLIQETHKYVNTLTTVLLGVPGTDDKGLVGEVKQIKFNQKEQWTSHSKLSTRVWMLWGIVLAIGVIASGVITLTGGWGG